MKSGTFCFKFSVLRQMYKNRLSDLGINKEIKFTLKNRFLSITLTPRSKVMERTYFLFSSWGCRKCSRGIKVQKVGVTIKKIF